MTDFQWQQECTYIANVTDAKGNVPEMNHDKATFIRYCEMQAAQAGREGFYETQTYIQECIDELNYLN